MRSAIAAALAIASTVANARDSISCTGIMIDVDIDPHMSFPYAAVYDANNSRTCMLNRGPAGHDPLRGICNAGERCTISGPYKRRVRETYFFDFSDSKVSVSGVAGIVIGK
jgi:hypothetical protein